MSKTSKRSGPFLRIVSAAVVAACVAGTAVQASEPVTPKLTPKLRSLLKQEMTAIQQAMQTVHLAIVTGDHATVGKQAHAIHNSFILKQSLTPDDRKALKAAVPPEFVKLDQAFHGMAATLADAASVGDSKGEVRLFNEMTHACMACHSRYVTDRFPDLADQEFPLPQHDSHTAAAHEH